MALNKDALDIDTVWTNVANWGGVALPIDTDTVRISNRTNGFLTGLGQSLIQLADLLASATMIGNVGASGDPLVIDSTDVTWRSGAAESWLKGDFVDFIAGPQLLAPNALQIESLATDGNVDRLYVERGRVSLVGATLVDNIFMNPPAGDAILVIPSAAVISTDIHINSGRVLFAGTCNGIVYVGGNGILEFTDDAADANRVIMDGGTVIFNKGAISNTGGAATPTVLVKAGHFNATGHNLFKTIHTMHIVSNTATVNVRTDTKAIDITNFKQIGAATFIGDDGKTY